MYRITARLQPSPGPQPPGPAWPPLWLKYLPGRVDRVVAPGQVISSRNQDHFKVYSSSKTSLKDPIFV